MRFLRDVQIEVPYIQSRWLLGEVAGSAYVFDDVGGIILPNVGMPTLGLQSLAELDVQTSAQGGYSGALAGFTGSVAAYLFSNGVTIEGATARDPNGVSFNLFSAPGQASLVVAGANVQFSIWTGSQHTLTATGVISGWPQLVQGTYDPVAQLQTIYVDGAQVAQQALSGAVAGVTTGNTVLLTATSSATCVARGQDVAVYNGALSANRIAEHFQTFMQDSQDPHVLTYSPPGVTS